MFFFIIIRIWESLQHVSVQVEHLRVIHVSKITKKIPWLMGILYINEISLVQMIGLY